MKPNEVKSTCSYCGVGCGVLVKKDLNNKVDLRGDEDHPVNKGMLCSKGRNLHYVVNDQSDRIMYPEMRWSRSHPRERVSWDTALDRAGSVFKTIIDKYGPDSVGFYVSGQCLTEEYYIANKLTKGFLGTNNLDTNSRLCMSSAVAAYKRTFGEDSVPISYDDIELADCFLIAGANPSWCHPILFRRIENHKEKHPEVKIIVVDPRETDSAKVADLHLQIMPGTDVALFHAIGRILIEEDWMDSDFVVVNTEDYFAYKKSVFEFSLTQYSRICGISEEKLRLAARYIGKASGFISMWAMGLNQSASGTDKNCALINLSLLTGHVGKPGSGPFSLTGQPNAMGGREVGGMANLLAVHKDLQNPLHREQVAQFWGVERINEKPGLTATEMVSSMESGELKAVWVVCTNPLVSLPNSNRVERAFKNARFVVVQDISYNSDTIGVADLVLPAAGWLEKEGTMTNSERRISYLPKLVPPPGEARPDVDILCDFARRMGFRGFNYQNSEEIYREYSQMTKGTNIDISYLSYDRLKSEGSFQWPVREFGHQGTPRLFQDHKFYTPSKKAILNIPASINVASQMPDKHFPYILTTGRVRDQWHTMTRTGKVSRLKTHYVKPVLEINPIDGEIANIKNGDVVEIKSEYGLVRLRAKLTTAIRKGVVFLPMHWGKQLQIDLNRTNNLTSNRVDPISREPDFKYTRVSVSRYSKPREKIVVAGAGAAAFRFIQNYRDQNKADEIQVFSGEKYPFYNRVLLPEYVTNTLTWEELKKIKEEGLIRLRIRLNPEKKLTHINPKDKIVWDETGEKHVYDRLILATGSRAFVPNDAQIHLPGRFKLRNRVDADMFKVHLESIQIPDNEKHVVIVGGGVLGLEMAAALNHSNIRVTIVQRSSSLMERQLDRVSSQLLAEHVQKKGIQIYFDNEVSTAFDEEDGAGMEVTLKSGKIFHAHAILYAIGTRPNIELARECGLSCGRGVHVNQYFQTSDPHIYAIGEIAEFNNELFGITSAAEEQADLLAGFIAGDIGSVYEGSVPMNILKFNDLNLCSLGKIKYPANDPSYEQIVFSDTQRGYYKKCIVKDDLLIGAVLMGDKNEFAEFKSLIENKIELSDKRDQLLRGNSTQRPVKGRLVCSCSQVGEGNLTDAVRSGCHDFNTLCSDTGAGLGCGSCKTEVRQILLNSKTLI